VTGPGGELVQDLTARDFAVSEDGEPQTITAFASSDVPLAVALAIDRSFSIPADRLRSAAVAAAGFIRALQPSDQVMVIGVGSEVEVLAPLSDSRAAALDALARVDSWGTTPLYDAARHALDLIHAAVTGGRSALASDPQRLAAVFDGVAAELRAQYLLGYSPAREPASAPQWRSIGVRVSRPGVSVRARDGYFGS
jgi:hypothetical protein